MSSPRHRHKYARLSDTAIFCACGAVKNLEPVECSRQHYPTYWWAPYIAPYVAPTYYPWWGTATTATDVRIGDTVYGSTDDSVTYTLTGGTE